MNHHELSVLFLVIYVVLIAGIGIYYSKSKNNEDYFLASRKLPAWLLAVTFIASWWGGGSAIDLVDHAHTNGLNSFWIYGVPVLLATGLMYVFSKGIRNLGHLSQPQLMQARYDRRTGLLLSIFILLFMLIAAAIQVIVIGKFFEAFFNISYETGAVLGTAIVLLYSLFGGFKGVVVTDLLQFVFFLLAGIFLFYFTYTASGGMQAVQQQALLQQKTGFTSFFHKVPDQLAYVITFGTSWMIQANVWQRISAAKTGSDAKRMMLYSFIAFIPLYLMVTYTGMFASVLYEDLPSSGIVPTMVAQIEQPILSAMIFVGLSAAIMSTMDSLLNTGAMALSVDIYQNHLKPQSSNKEKILVARVATLLMAAIALFIALKIKSVLKVSWIGSDFLTSGAFVPLVMGFLWYKGSSQAAFYTMLYGLAFSSYHFAIALGADLPLAWEVASTQQALVGIGGAFILYVSLSYCTSSDYNQNKAFIRKANILKR
ncbi:sodium:solute symporter [Mesonia sediminis]|uniref:Sodium:solute symporter n=1 Tax=Mesonia sediminis TaxID=1703946 RepID=A0ABW5SBI3_9FLAO